MRMGVCVDMRMNIGTGICMDILHSHVAELDWHNVYRYVYRYVCGRVYRYVYRHVYRHVY